MSDEQAKRFGAYYRPTGKGRATRYGTGGIIGAVFDRRGRLSGIDPDVVVAIPIEQANLYRREYARMVREGALEPVTEKEYAAYMRAAAKREEAARKAAEKARAEKKGEEPGKQDDAAPAGAGSDEEQEDS